MIGVLRTVSILCVGIACAIGLPACVTAVPTAEVPQQHDAGPLAAEELKASGVSGGVIVHLGCGDGRDTAELLLGSSYQVHGLDTSSANVAKARDYLRSKNLYGPVSVAQYNGKNLPYGDNIVNLIIADTLGDVSAEEAMRVLTPLGGMIVGGKKTVKPWPDNIDDWPQYLNKADNNAVAKDSVAGPPRLIQWVNDRRQRRSAEGLRQHEPHPGSGLRPGHSVSERRRPVQVRGLQHRQVEEQAACCSI